MHKVLRTILSLLFLFVVTSCSNNKECNKFNKTALNKLESEFAVMSKSDKAHELYLYGECKVTIAKPILMRYKNSKLINHHLRHKGMTLGYIANGSLKKLEAK